MLLKSKRLRFWGLLIYFVFAVLSETIPYGNYFLIIGLCMLFAAYLLQHKGRFKLNYSPILLYLLIFTVYCFLSKYWAENPNLTRHKTNAMIFIFAAMVIVYYCWNNKGYVDDLLKVIMYGGYVVTLYVLAQYGAGILSVISSQTRAGDVLNSNVVGMNAAYSLLINAYYILCRKKLKPQDLLIIPALVMILASGSRKAFLIAVGGFFALCILKNINRKNFVKSGLKIFGIIVLLAALLYGLMQLPFMSGIAKRMEAMITVLTGGGSRSTDGWLRVQYVKLGWQLFKSHPFLGIGLGNANIYTMAAYGHDHYLHNNFVEVLATLGGVGFILYYSLYVYFLSQYWKYRKRRDPLYDITLILLLIRLAMDYGNVTFYGKDTYVFVMLFWLEIRQLKSSRAMIQADFGGIRK